MTGNEVVGTDAPGADPQAQAAPRDLTTVTDEQMEAVDAESSDLTGMRLALAHRYLDAADYMAAASVRRTPSQRERQRPR